MDNPRSESLLGNRNAEAHDIRGEGDLILIRLRAGDYFKTACARAGVPYSTAKRWLRLGRGGEGSTWGNYICREDHVWFYNMVEYVLSEVEGMAVDYWMDGIRQGDWHAARDFLARRFPRRWGRATRPEPDLSRPDELVTELDLICAEPDAVSSAEPDQPPSTDDSSVAEIPVPAMPASVVAPDQPAPEDREEDSGAPWPPLPDHDFFAGVPFIAPPTVLQDDGHTIFLDRPTSAQPFPVIMNRHGKRQKCTNPRILSRYRPRHRA
jgi:hypothetical protein